ncbi:MAG: hypothetical protein QCI38_00770 [Candidatus Thermoplasmatota archaeon]|nr:hypothetical protein [Candidatus Thermoplasmatota archaeon]
MSRSVYVEAPSRLHFGFTATDPQGLISGSAGVALDNPTLRFRLEAVDGGSRECVGPCADEILVYAEKCIGGECHDMGLVARVAEYIPRHVGLGSGTQMSISAGKAAGLLFQREMEVEEIASFFSRGARSRVGIEAFKGGGFVFCNGGEPKRMKVPENWGFIFAIPHGQNMVSGEDERSKLASVRPLNGDEQRGLEEARENMLIAFKSQDIQTFGTAVTNLDRITGKAFSPVQGGDYTNALVEGGLKLAMKEGAAGGGQSSWGPGFFAIVEKGAGAHKVALSLFEYLHHRGGGDVFLSAARNTGALVRPENL